MRKQHLPPESTPNLPPNLNNKTTVKSKSIQELESFIDQKCNELALGSLKRDAEMKQQISQELEAHYNQIYNTFAHYNNSLLLARRATGIKSI